jgi:Tfp pilus assembly protein PilF
VGNSYLRQSDLVTARKDYLKALGNDPNFAVANANLAWVDAQEGKDLNSALGMAQKAKSTMPDVPSITDTLAWVMYKKGDYAGAIPLLRECIGKSPDSATFRYHLGMTFLATGQKAAGKSQLEAALRMKLSKDEAQEAQRELSQLN